jgi:glucose 1-dehydrogenase
MSDRLAGRTALVTGASSGIGRGVALRLAEHGAFVVAADLREEPRWDPDDLRPTTELITARGGAAVFAAADVSVRSEVDRVVAAAAEHSGRIDIVVNCAGIFGSSSILDTTDEEWHDYLQINLTSQFLVCRAVLGRMVQQEARDDVRGRIVNIASQLGVTAPPAHLAYSVTKAGCAQLTRQLAVDYAQHGVLVNAVGPGRIITGTHPGEREYLASGTVDSATEYSLSRTPFPRLGRPADVAGAVLFLSSDDCTFVSGHVLMVDGGWTAY